LVLSLGAEREYAGNVGYDDELDTVYRYDSFVPNHRQITEGDLLILCDRKKVLRIAKASRIVSFQGLKEQSRCEQCESTVIKTRKTRLQKYRCRNGHEFDEPLKEEVSCSKYEAYFDGVFQRVPGHIPVGEVRKACPNYNAQLSMQKVELARLAGAAKVLAGLAKTLSEARRGLGLVAEDASEEPYVPDGRDDRKVIARQIRERRGQAAFRRELRSRFGDTCLVTGCKLPDLLEAAHINPHRGDKDNHPSNGLLLRADIHTLFDLDLLGIEPTTLQLHVHPRLKGTEYEQFAGRKLACEPGLLSSKALEDRWKTFVSARGAGTG
jgi:putative restriction endonuclease